MLRHRIISVMDSPLLQPTESQRQSWSLFQTHNEIFNYLPLLQVTIKIWCVFVCSLSSFCTCCASSSGQVDYEVFKSHSWIWNLIFYFIFYMLEWIFWCYFASCRIDKKKSTSGTCHFIGTSLIAWFSRKQSSIAQSIVESGYVAIVSCWSPLLWLERS